MDFVMGESFGVMDGCSSAMVLKRDAHVTYIGHDTWINQRDEFYRIL